MSSTIRNINTFMPEIKSLYEDLDIQFKSHPVTGAIKTLKDEKAVGQSLKILALTDQYERLYQPDIYTNIKASLFEPMTPTLTSVLTHYIKTAVRNYEPRADLINVNILAEEDQNRVGIKLTYSTINNSTPVTVQFFLEKLR